MISASYDGTNYLTSALSQYGEAGWFIDSWTGMYVNRVRGSIGFEYRLSKASRIDISLLADRIVDKVVDANAEGTKLKSYTRETGFVGWINIGYSYSF